MSKEYYKKRAKVLKAMAHPSRLAMLEALSQGELCVCDLQALVGSDMSTVSKHLSKLKKAGLVADRKQGLWVHYRLRVPCVMEFMGCIQAVIEDQKSRDVSPLPSATSLTAVRTAAKAPAAACCRR
jgi:ArsR family transcriptional regulator